MSSETSADMNPTHPVRQGDEFDVAAVDAALKAAGIERLSGTPAVTQFPSGASNLTYALDYPDRSLVLRRPPTGTKPKSGHDMNREYTVMTALKGHLPVPETLFYTDDESIIGAEFYVMDKTEGHILHTQIPKEWNWSEAETRKLCENFFQTFVDMHKIDYKAIGLGDYGKPEGYAERQVMGWEKRFARVVTDNIDPYEDLRKWIIDNRPKGETGAAIVHGDYRIDNCILNANDPTQIDAILDWEISALGDPMMDLGNTLAYWIEASDPPAMHMMIRQPSAAPGMMSRQEIADLYARETGADVSDIQYYYVFGIWRLAVIIQQIYYRYHVGQTDNARFAGYNKMTEGLAQLAQAKIDSGKL